MAEKGIFMQLVNKKTRCYPFQFPAIQAAQQAPRAVIPECRYRESITLGRSGFLLYDRRENVRSVICAAFGANRITGVSIYQKQAFPATPQAS